MEKHKPFSRQLLTAYLPKNPIIVEAGAHIGRDTLKLIKLFPDATIHAFEPIPENFALLKQHTAAYPTISCYNVALSDKTGTASLYVSRAQTAISSLLKPALIAQEKPTILFDTIIVQTITLDEWAHTYTIDRVDFLWLDMQGAELAALKAGTNLLKTVQAILIEVSLTERYEKNPLYPTVKQWLEMQGFILVSEHLHHTTWGNALFAR